MTDEIERARFEKFLSDRFPNIAYFRHKPNSPDEYLDGLTGTLFATWQAALSSRGDAPTQPFQPLTKNVILQWPDFDNWWEADGRFYDPDTSDVPWYDKRQSLAEYAFLRAKQFIKQTAALQESSRGGAGTPQEENATLRKRIHHLEGHNQYFFRCESAWCNPGSDMNPALETIKALEKRAVKAEAALAHRETRAESEPLPDSTTEDK